jgi:hypothetical protein
MICHFIFLSERFRITEARTRLRPSGQVVSKAVFAAPFVEFVVSNAETPTRKARLVAARTDVQAPSALPRHRQGGFDNPLAAIAAAAPPDDYSIASDRAHRAADDALYYPRSATAALIIVALIVAAAAILVDGAVMRMADVPSAAVPTAAAMHCRDMVTTAVVAFSRENRRSGKGNTDGEGRKRRGDGFE